MKKNIISITMALILLFTFQFSTTVFAFGDAYSTISAGKVAIMVIKSDGSLWGWGANFTGAVGDTGTERYGSSGWEQQMTPVKVNDGFVSVSTGYYHTMGIKSDGSLWGWGGNDYGCQGNGENATIYDDADTDNNKPIKIMDDVAAVSAGKYYTMAIKKDGSLWGWGYDNTGQLGDGNYNFKYGKSYISSRTKPFKVMDGVIAVSTNTSGTMVIKKDGSLWGWGFLPYGDGKYGERYKPVKIMDGVTSVSLGNNIVMVIKKDGSLWGWGDNSLGGIGIGKAGETPYDVTTLYPVKVMDKVASVSVGADHVMAIKKDGTLWGWGNDMAGQLGDGTEWDLKGPDNISAVPIKVMDGVASVSTYYQFTIALKNDGSIWTWGWNHYGGIGNEKSDNQLKPFNVLTDGMLPGVVKFNPLDTASSWAKEGITTAISNGFVPTGLQDMYTNTITRAEFCKLAVKWLQYKLNKPITDILSERNLTIKHNAFSDTNDPDILAAYALGITNGTKPPTATEKGLFSPDGQFSREQAATMVRNTCKVAGMDVSNNNPVGFEDIDKASNWAVDGINFVKNAGIMGGTSTTPLLYSPKDTYTREQSIITFGNIK